MAFSNVTYKIPGTNNYALAEMRWSRFGRAPRGAAWSPHQRPLYNNRSWHYRIERGEQDGQVYYDICHYRTALARFYAPGDDGFERRLYRGWNSRSSKGFMYNVLALDWVEKHPAIRMLDLDGVMRWVPIGHMLPVYEGVGTVDLYVAPNGRFDLQRSRHVSWVRPVMSVEEKLRRAALREQLRPWVMLMYTQVHTWVQEGERDYANHRHIPKIGSTHNVPYRYRDRLAKFFAGDEKIADITDAIREVLRLHVINAVLHALEYGDSLPSFDNWQHRATAVLLPMTQTYMKHIPRPTVDIQQFMPAGKPWSTTWREA